MFWSTAVPVGASLAKRALSGDPDSPNDTYDLPPLTIGLAGLILLLFLPAFLIAGYSLKTVYPVLAIVENPNPPAYEAVAADDNDAAPAAANGDDAGVPASPTAITSSLRRTFRVLYSNGGWRGNIRGLAVAFVTVLLTVLIASVILPFAGSAIASLVATFVLIQLDTVWVHTVIRSTPSNKFFWNRLPPFRRTFQALSIPMFFVWAAHTVTAYAAVIVGQLLHVPQWKSTQPHEVPKLDGSIAWKGLILVIVSIVLSFLLVLPATVTVVRVQASLLPPEDDTVVPFDRSFGGLVDPVVVDGRGYVSWRDAIRTFSRSSWKRLVILYAKVYAVSILVNVLFVAIVLPLVIFTARKKTEGN